MRAGDPIQPARVIETRPKGAVVVLPRPL